MLPIGSAGMGIGAILGGFLIVRRRRAAAAAGGAGADGADQGDARI